MSKTIYDFKSNIRKLSHHHYSKNKKSNSKEPKENQIQKKQIMNDPYNCMSPNEIHNLLSIECKTDEIKSNKYAFILDYTLIKRYSVSKHKNKNKIDKVERKVHLY
jgi:hypothetical protein